MNSKGTNNPINKWTDELIDLKGNTSGNKYLKKWPSDECKSKPLFHAVRIAIKRTVSSYLSQPRGFTHLRLSCHSEKCNFTPPPHLFSSRLSFTLWPTPAPQASFPTLPRKPPSLLRGCWSTTSKTSITVSMAELSFLPLPPQPSWNEYTQGLKVKGNNFGRVRGPMGGGRETKEGQRVCEHDQGIAYIHVRK